MATRQDGHPRRAAIAVAASVVRRRGRRRWSFTDEGLRANGTFRPQCYARRQGSCTPRCSSGCSRSILNDEFPENGRAFAPVVKGTPVHDHALDRGRGRPCTSKRRRPGPRSSCRSHQFWGDRYGVVRDPFGHHGRWPRTSKDLTPEQIKKAGEEAYDDTYTRPLYRL